MGLPLGEGRHLEMKAAHDTIAGHGFVVLHKMDGAYLLFEFTLGERLEEVAASVPEHFRFDDDNTFYCCFNNFHKYLCFRFSYELSLIQLNMAVKQIRPGYEMKDIFQDVFIKIKVAI